MYNRRCLYIAKRFSFQVKLILKLVLMYKDDATSVIIKIGNKVALLSMNVATAGRDKGIWKVLF